MSRKFPSTRSQTKGPDDRKVAAGGLAKRPEAVVNGSVLDDKAEYLRSTTEDTDLVPDTLDPQQLHSALSLRIKRACRELGIPCSSSAKIADYALDLAIEVKKKKPLWMERTGEDKLVGNPIKFLNKYWGVEIRSGRFYQSDLRQVDISLFEAVRRYCRNNDMDPKGHLPPPLKQRAQKRRDQVEAVIAKTSRQMTTTVPTRSREQAAKRAASGMGARL
jgi:hypothetical protein